MGKENIRNQSVGHTLLEQTDYLKSRETGGVSILPNLEWPIMGSVEMRKFPG
jgi:hypothetical protein